MGMNFAGLNQAALSRIVDVLNSVLPGGEIVGNEYRCADLTGGKGRSVGVNLTTGVWSDFSTGQSGGDLVALVAESRRCKMGEAYTYLADHLHYTNGTGEATPAKNLSKQTEIIVPPPVDVALPKFNGIFWTYRDFDGRPLFFIERVDIDGKKQFFPTSWSQSSSGWVRRAWPGKRPLYGLELLTARPKAPVMIVEGEKAADAARLLCPAYVVVTWSGGSKAWNKTDIAPLYSRQKILLWPDADQPGVEAMRGIASVLAGKVGEIKILNVADMPPGFDAADFNIVNDSWSIWAKPRAEIFATSNEGEKIELTPDVPRGTISEPPPFDDMPMPTERDAPRIEQLPKSKPTASQWPGPWGFYDMQENSKGEDKPVPMYEEMAQWCFDNRNLCFTDKEQLKYDGKKWEWMDKVELGSLVRKWNKGYLKPAHLDNFVKQLRIACFTKELGIDPELSHGHLNVANGLVKISTGELLPHDYRMRFRYCSPIVYDPKAECPRWEQFLLDTFDQNLELVDLAQRLFGYVLIGGRPFLHKAFVLYGSGRNGKSTFLDVLRAVIGKDAYSTVSMAKLDKEFSLVNLEGKLANIVEETPNEAINSEVFKTLVGGGETTVAHKGFDEYQLRVDARFVFACNDYPVFKDKSVGLEERLVFIPFDRYIAEEDRDTEILDKLYTELPGILNFALQGAKIMAKSRTIPKYVSIADSKERFRMESDPVYAWCKDELEIIPHGTPLSSAEIYRRYRADMAERGNGVFSRDKFLKQMRKHVGDECQKKGIFFDRKLRDGSGGARGIDVVRFVHSVPSQAELPVHKYPWNNKD